MRGAVGILVVALLATGVGGAMAQTPAAPGDLTHGEFAVLLLKVVAFQDRPLPPDEALVQVKRLGLAPANWTADGVLTHGEFADVLLQFGIVYVPSDRSTPASQAFVEAFLRRELWRMRDYLGRKVLDEGSDRALSGHEFCPCCDECVP